MNKNLKKIFSIISIMYLSVLQIGTVNVFAENYPVKETEEFRAIWISYLEYSDNRTSIDPGYQAFFQGRTEEEAKATVREAFDKLKSVGINVVITQVRPFGDAIYPTELAPRSIYVSPKTSDRKQGDELTWDPLQFMIEEAHARDMEIHAWFNPYRISPSNNDFGLLAENNIAKVWYNSNDTQKKNNVKVLGSRITLNPASDDVMNHISDVVKEVADKYDVDGIHFDDYFYPELSDAIDKEEYDKYLADNGLSRIIYDDNDEYKNYVYKELPLEYLSLVSGEANITVANANLKAAIEGTDTVARKAAIKRHMEALEKEQRALWRMTNVDKMVKKVYDVVHSETTKNPNLVFGISPQGRIFQNYSSQMADVEKWISTSGYIDYINPQIYYGFKNNLAPFAPTADEWATKTTVSDVKIYAGLPVYKVGTFDTWAGAANGAQMEFMIEEPTMMKRMIQKTREVDKIKGFVFFDYRALFRPTPAVQYKILGELEGIKQLTLGNPDVSFSLIDNPYILKGANSTMEWALLNSNTYTECTTDMDLSSQKDAIVAAKGFTVRFKTNTKKEKIFNIGKAAAPAFTLNYQNRTTNGPIPQNSEYSLDGVNWTTGTGVAIPVEPILGKKYYFKNKIDHLAFESEVQTLEITQSMLPSVSGNERLTFYPDGTVKFTNLQDIRYYQYRLPGDATNTWREATKPSGTGTGLESKPLTGIPTDIQEIEIRIKYTTLMFASDSKIIPVEVVTTEASPTFTIDYINGTTNEVLPTNIKYKIGATGEWTSGNGTKLKLNPDTTYDIFFVKVKEDGTHISEESKLTVPQSIVSANIEMVLGSTEGNTRRLINLQDYRHYDYSIDGGQTWLKIIRTGTTSPTSGTCNDFTPDTNTILLRVRAASNVLQSNPVLLTYANYTPEELEQLLNKSIQNSKKLLEENTNPTSAEIINAISDLSNAINIFINK